MSKDYKEILWFNKFDGTGYGVWARRSVEALQSSNDFLVKIGCPFPLPTNDSLSPLQEIEVKDPYIIHNFIPNYKIREKKGGFCKLQVCVGLYGCTLCLVHPVTKSFL